ncbi:hypothetical protein [Burkholderia lata]|uniref:hypothetical protein n=1 Tax=Burkholderia lata (strain ATCC 17760 / DSM 23089 / LMG 22485 / NCIMB 9086 / R18194 / 383) TaxID=482957 RepID=UPI0015840C3B
MITMNNRPLAVPDCCRAVTDPQARGLSIAQHVELVRGLQAIKREAIMQKRQRPRLPTSIVVNNGSE